jgi:hypothetical protein
MKNVDAITVASGDHHCIGPQLTTGSRFAHNLGNTCACTDAVVCSNMQSRLILASAESLKLGSACSKAPIGSMTSKCVCREKVSEAMRAMVVFNDLVSSCWPSGGPGRPSAEVLTTELIRMAQMTSMDFCKELECDPVRAHALFGPQQCYSVWEAFKAFKAQKRSNKIDPPDLWTKRFNLPIEPVLSSRVAHMVSHRIKTHSNLRKFEESRALAPTFLCITRNTF